jgi:hypothetical protein
VDAYIGRTAEFAPPILEHLRELVHRACPDCEEAIKWGMPAFLYQGRILASMAAFKQHASFGVWGGSASAADAAGQGRADEGMGQYGRLTGVRDLPGKRELAASIRQGMARIDSGAPRTAPRATRPPLEVPGDLATALAGNAAARAHFEGFPPSARREYIEWITEAKQAATRQRRLAQALAWLAEGKRRHWKYERC